MANSTKSKVAPSRSQQASSKKRAVAEVRGPLLPVAQFRGLNAVAVEGGLFEEKSSGFSDGVLGMTASLTRAKSMGAGGWRNPGVAATAVGGMAVRPSAAELKEMDEICTKNMIENLDKVLF